VRVLVTRVVCTAPAADDEAKADVVVESASDEAVTTIVVSGALVVAAAEVVAATEVVVGVASAVLDGASEDEGAESSPPSADVAQR